MEFFLSPISRFWLMSRLSELRPSPVLQLQLERKGSEIWIPVLEEFEVGEETVQRFLKELHLITGKLSESDKPDFSVENQEAIEKTIFGKLELERFVPETK